MTTAPTPSEQVWQLSCALEIAAALPDMPQVTIPRIDALEAAAALQRLERENDNLRTERHDALCKVEAMEPELARLQAENRRLRAEQAQAMSEASSLAMSLFQKHYSSDPDYASGAVKFGLCDELRGVISQIDNMSTGLARAELEARKPLPLSDDDRLRLRSDVARAIWDVMREHEDRCDHALEDVDPKHQVWDCADAAIETALGIIPRPNPLIASREVVADGPVRVTRLHLTEEGRAGLTSKATSPLPSITGGSS